MGTIDVSQPGGRGDVIDSGAIDVGTRCYLSAIGFSAVSWTLTSRPVGSSAATHIHPRNGWYFDPDVLGPYGVRFTDSSSGTHDGTFTATKAVTSIATPVSVVSYGAKGDGVTDDRAAVVAALASISPNGGSLYFPAGVYYLSASIPISGYSNLEISGDYRAQFLLTKNQLWLDISSCTNMSIHGLRVTGTIQVDGGDPFGGNVSQTAVRLVSCSNVEVFDNHIEQVGGYAVFVSTNNSHINIHHNMFEQTMAGVQTAGAAGTINIDGLWITDNHFVGFIPTGGAGTVGSDDQIAVFDGPTSNVVIARNYIDKRGVDATSKAKVQARCIDLSVGSGSTFKNVLVIDNICVNCYSSDTLKDRPAIDITGGVAGSTLTGLIVARNIVRTANAGISIQFGTSSTFTDALIAGNQVYDIQHASGSTPGRGIVLLNNGNGAALFSRIKVIDNIIDTVPDTGIYGGFYTSDVEIRANLINSPGARGIDLGGVGTNFRAADNTIVSAGTYGLVVQNNTRDCIVSGNDIRTTVNEGLYLSGLTDLRAVNNTVRGSSGGNGILLQSNTNVLVMGNDSSGNASAGLISLTLNTNVRYVGNSFHDNTGFGINYQDTNGSASFEANYLTGNTAGAFNDASTTSSKWFGINPQLTKSIVGNNRGQVTIVDANTTGTVTFPTAEPDANYMVVVTSNPQTGATASTASVTGKGTGGFTVNLTAAPSAGHTTLVDWQLLR